MLLPGSVSIRHFVAIASIAFLGAIAVLSDAEGALRDGEVTLAWDANPESDIAGYRVYIGSESGIYPDSQDAGDQTSTTVAGLNPSLTYYFVVTAYNDAGLESLPSEEVSTDPTLVPVPAPDTIPVPVPVEPTTPGDSTGGGDVPETIDVPKPDPVQPTEVEDVPANPQTDVNQPVLPTSSRGPATGEGSVSLAWDSNPEPDIAGYRVYFGTESGIYPESIDAGAATAATVDGLDESIGYYFVVTAYNVAGLESLPSEEVSAVPTLDPNPQSDPDPVVPTDPIVTGDDDPDPVAPDPIIPEPVPDPIVTDVPGPVVPDPVSPPVDDPVVEVPLNVPPAVSLGTLVIREGSSAPVTDLAIKITDSDTSADSIVLTVTDVRHGNFRVRGTVRTSFTLAQLKASKVTFLHDGSEFEPAFKVSASDGKSSSPAVDADIVFQSVNDPPFMTVATLAIKEGSRTVFDPSLIRVSDVDTLESNLRVRLTDASGGYLEVSGRRQGEFTIAELRAGHVAFVHHGVESSPLFNLIATDGVAMTPPVLADIAFEPVDDTPVVSLASFKVKEGERTVLGTSHISVLDTDTSKSDLLVRLLATAGHVEVAGQTRNEFSVTELEAGSVSFVHDGSEAVPAFQVTVSDRSTASDPITAEATYETANDAPVLTVNQFPLREQTPLRLSPSHLAASDSDSRGSDLLFTVSDLIGGTILVRGDRVFHFFQQDVVAGEVLFIPVGEGAPSFSIAVSDADKAGATQVTPAQVIFTSVNDAPSLTTELLVIAEGQSVTLTTDHIIARDVDTPDASLIYTVRETGGSGRFQLKGTEESHSTLQFSHAQLLAGSVIYFHDDSELLPEFTVSVSDGITATASQAAPVSFTPINDAPSLSLAAFEIFQGAKVTLTTSLVQVSDADSPESEWTFLVSEVVGGSLLVDRYPAGRFTSTQLAEGRVQLRHDDSLVAPSMLIAVTDRDGGVSLPRRVTPRFLARPAIHNVRLLDDIEIGWCAELVIDFAGNARLFIESSEDLKQWDRVGSIEVDRDGGLFTAMHPLRTKRDLRYYRLQVDTGGAGETP